MTPRTMGRILMAAALCMLLTHLLLFISPVSRGTAIFGIAMAVVVGMGGYIMSRRKQWP